MTNYERNITPYDTKKALHLAGKLAMSVEMVISSSALDVSFRLQALESTLREYNEYMLRSVEC
jgi:hypothetical protein